MTYPTQIVFVLDAEGDHPDSELLPHINANRYACIPYRLSSFEPPPVSRTEGKRLAVDWDGLVDAAERMISTARTYVESVERSIEVYAAGLAPLPLFVYFGMELSSWGPPLVFLNRRKSGQWDVLPTSGHISVNEDEFFDIAPSLTEAVHADGTGYVALFVSTNGQAGPRDLIRNALREDGKELADVIEVRTSVPKYLDAETFPTAANQIARHVSQIAGTHPHAAGLAVFVFGPASLAYLVGRAINPTMFPEVLVANFNSPHYEIVLRQPRPGRPAQPISTRPEDEAARTEVFMEVKAGIDNIRETIQEQDLPDFLGESGKKRFWDNIQRVQLPAMTQGDSFELYVLQERMTIGRGLLEALRPNRPESIRRIAALLFLHEVYHFDQNLQTTNYRNIGRAGVALEEVDYWADAVAVCALTLHDIRCGQSSDGEVLGNFLVTNVDSVLSGIEAFDRFEQGEQIRRLTERRLRRYLIWHLQLARARTKPRTRAEVHEMLSERLIVELAPLVGSVDSRFEKMVHRSHTATELVVVLGKRLFRYSANANFDPEGMVQCVRKFQGKDLIAPMDYVVGEHYRDLAPWVR